MTTPSLSDTQLETIEQQLWAPIFANNQPMTLKVFAIFDGARDRRIEPMLHNGELEQTCLYKGTISYAVKRAAPHSVALQKGHPLTHTLLRTGWGKSCGVFLYAHLKQHSGLLTCLSPHVKSLIARR